MVMMTHSLRELIPMEQVLQGRLQWSKIMVYVGLELHINLQLQVSSPMSACMYQHSSCKKDSFIDIVKSRINAHEQQ